MTRLTVTLTQEQNDRLRQQAEAKRVTISELVRDVVEDAIRAWDKSRSAVPGFVGIASVDLPYSAEDMDRELAKTFGKD